MLTEIIFCPGKIWNVVIVLTLVEKSSLNCGWEIASRLTCSANYMITSAPALNSAPLFFPDVEAFAKAMETETKSDQDGDSKDKKDDDEDMSLDWALF